MMRVLFIMFFSCKEQKIVSSSIVKHKPLTIVEGSYSLNPLLGHYYDISIFLKVTEDEQLKRLKLRNLNIFMIILMNG